MKFSCEKALLQAAIATTSRAVSPKSSIPALEGILLEADDMLRLTGYNLETGAYRQLLQSRTMPPPITDIRCDLHNLFAFDGKYISYDTTENGCRQIALVPIEILNF